MKAKIRAFDRDKDWQAVREMYEHRKDKLNPLNPLNGAAIVAEDKDGKIVGWFAARPVVAVHTVVDDSYGDRKDRFEMIMDMSRHMAELCHKSGMNEAVYECPHPYENMGAKIARFNGIEENSHTYTVHIEKFLKNWEGN